jgi:hypothetical protein
VKRGDRIEVVFSGTDPGIGLVVKKARRRTCRAERDLLGWRID